MPPHCAMKKLRNNKKYVKCQVRLSSPAPDSPSYTYLDHSRQEQAPSSPLTGISTVCHCDVEKRLLNIHCNCSSLLMAFLLFRPSERNWSWQRLQSNSSGLLEWVKVSPGCFCLLLFSLQGVSCSFENAQVQTWYSGEEALYDSSAFLLTRVQRRQTCADGHGGRGASVPCKASEQEDDGSPCWSPTQKGRCPH